MLAERFARSPFQSLQREMDRLFEDFFGTFDTPWPSLASDDRLITPRLDVKEDDKAFVVSAELPGVDQKDIEVSMSGGGLVIKGEKKAETKEEKANYLRVERSYGSFMRTLPLPAEVDQNKIEAAFSNGVLTVTLPKSEEAKRTAKKIAVKAK